MIRDDSSGVYQGNVVEFSLAPNHVPKLPSCPFLSSASNEKCPPATGLAIKVT